MFASNPFLLARMLVPFSARMVMEGRAQYPVEPVVGPRRGFPSGQRGAGPPGARLTVSSGTLKMRRPPAVTVFPHTCLLRSEEHTSELQSQSNLVCRLLLEKKKKNIKSERFATA